MSGKGVISRPAAMSISSIGRGPIPSSETILNCLAGDKEMVKHLPGMSRETGKPRGLQPINRVSRARLAGEEDMSFDIGRLADLSTCEQSRTYDQRVDVFENWNGAMVRPRFFVRNPSADRHVETAAQLLVHGGDCRHEDFDVGICAMESTKTRDQPAHSEAGWCTHPQNTARTWPSACFSCYGETIEGKTDLRRENARVRRRHHATPALHEEFLPKPPLQRADLPAHCAMCQAKLGRSCCITARTGGDFENAKGIEWRQTHRKP